MPTLTIDVSEKAYRTALALAPADLSRFLDDALIDWDDVSFAAKEREDDEYDPPSAEDLAAIGRGLQAVRDGHVVNGDAFFAELREKHGWQEKWNE